MPPSRRNTPTSRRGTLTPIAAHAAAGLLFGLAFPLAVWLAALPQHGLPLSPAGVAALHRRDPSQRILDLVPLALGALSVFIGWRQARIAAQRRELQEKVAQLVHANAGLAAEGAERRQAEAALRESETRFRTVIESLEEGILITDLDDVVQYVNPRLTQMTGYAPEDMLGRPAYELLLPPEEWPRMRRRNRQRGGGGGEAERYEVQLLRKDGTAFWAENFGAPYRDAEGRTIGTLGAITDVTRRKDYERQLTHQAFHDALTGLPNRALFQERLEHALARAAAQGRAVAVLFLDLDNFKVVNDSLGHQAGDRLLVTVAERLAGCVAPGDTVARLGGDEFTVLLEDLLPGEEAADAAEVAERVMARLCRPVPLGDHEAVTVPSVGVALSGTLGGDARATPADLMRDADTAMYQAKTAGKAGIVFFDAAMNERAMERLALEDDLRHALERGQMRVHFQPIVALDDAHRGGGGPGLRICEAEALARWEHPERGPIPPDRFIPLAEETGLIVPLGLWVLQEACRQAARWRAASPGGPPVVVGVNLAARQLRHPGLVADVLDALEAAGLPPHCLKLEITETAMMQDAEAVVGRLEALKARGVRLAVDDFGTGYSSMTYLRQFPVDTLKIDRSFVSRLGPDSEDAAEDAAIVQAIVTLGKTLHLQVTAEGVETADQLALLQSLGCDWGQGFFFARPLDAEAAASLILSLADAEAIPEAAPELLRAA